jgi:hypothetical protein
MNRSGAPLAAQRESKILPAAIAAAATGAVPLGKCSPRNAPRVAKILRYLSNPAATDRYTVQIVTAKQTRQKDINYISG